jgi:hypothetical protein
MTADEATCSANDCPLHFSAHQPNPARWC